MHGNIRVQCVEENKCSFDVNTLQENLELHSM